MFAVLLTTAALVVPAGFTVDPVLSARAAWVAGKPVAVHCAPDDATWQAYVAASGADAAGNRVGGLTPTTGGDATYLAPQVCAPIRVRLSRRTPNLYALGGAILTVAHEAMHLRGEADEGAAECAAMNAMPGFVVSQWGFRKGRSAYWDVLAGARTAHRGLPPQYRTVC